MVEIIKGRYGYRAEDGTVQIAEKGQELSLSEMEEAELIRKGCAVIVEGPVKAKETTPEQPQEPQIPKPRKRKGRKA